MSFDIWSYLTIGVCLYHCAIADILRALIFFDWFKIVFYPFDFPNTKNIASHRSAFKFTVPEDEIDLIFVPSAHMSAPL